MSMNRVQFQPGLSMPEFMKQFGTEDQCEMALFQARWPQGFRCPKCDHDGHCVLTRKGRKTFQCNACHHQTSIIAGTVFQGSKDMVTNNFPVSGYKDFPVRPELVEGWAGKSEHPPRQTVHASTGLSTNGLAGKVISESYF